ncbi:hypothetical protein ACR77J_11860 [Tissierella praeacuta]|uniref:hypothetical protein n=1 Tax=Tissierella praeacuta TaxID=43131 RepID=UPI003DA23E29
MIRLKIKQLFCKHKFVYLGKHKDIQEHLWQCTKCRIFLVKNTGILVSYKTNRPDIDEYTDYKE